VCRPQLTSVSAPCATWETEPRQWFTCRAATLHKCATRGVASLVAWLREPVQPGLQRAFTVWCSDTIARSLDKIIALERAAALREYTDLRERLQVFETRSQPRTSVSFQNMPIRHDSHDWMEPRG
jgi:hypothetical protein